MKKNLLIFIACVLFCSTAFAHQAPGILNTVKNTSQQSVNIKIVKQMFSQFAEKRDMSKFDVYYAKDFVLDSNGKTYNYQQYKNLEAKIYKTLKNLKVLRYDDIFAAQNKVVARMSIQLVNNASQVNTFKVILIAEIKNNKITHIWEITYPSWSDKLR